MVFEMSQHRLRPVFFFTLRMSFMTFLLRFPSLLAGGIAYNARGGP